MSSLLYVQLAYGLDDTSFVVLSVILSVLHRDEKRTLSVCVRGVYCRRLYIIQPRAPGGFFSMVGKIEGLQGTRLANSGEPVLRLRANL